MSDHPDEHTARTGDEGHDAHGHDAHGHAAPVVEEPEQPKQVPSYMYVAPLLILLVVLALLWGPVTGAFARYQGEAAEPAFETPLDTGEEPGAEVTATVEHNEPVMDATPVQGTPDAEGTVIPMGTEGPTVAPAPPTSSPEPATSTSAPATATSRPPTATVAPTETIAATATTAAGLPAEFGNTQAGALRSLEFGGQTFRVESSTIVADWVFSTEAGVASWVDGTVINYLVGLPVSEANAALFSATQPGDTVRLTIASGQVYDFQVETVTRVDKNDTSVMQQDRPAITLLLLGEATDDRAMIQGRYIEPTAR